MKDKCLLCGAPLTYLEEDASMTCALCHKTELSKTRCVNGHYVCSECHTAGLGGIIALCLHSDSRDPLAILEEMMAQPFCHMHGPEHHVMVGAALLTAYRNAGGKVDLENALGIAMDEGRVQCTRSAQNNQCIAARCPFNRNFQGEYA